MANDVNPNSGGGSAAVVAVVALIIVAIILLLIFTDLGRKREGETNVFTPSERTERRETFDFRSGDSGQGSTSTQTNSGSSFNNNR